MIINRDNELIKEVKHFLAVKEANISAAEFYIDYLNNYYDSITKNDIDNLTKKYNFEHSFFKAMIKKMDVSENNEELINLISICNIDKVNAVLPETFLNDEYIKKIGFIETKENNWSFKSLKYLPYEGFVLDELEIEQNYYAEHTPFSFFSKEMSYLALIENDCIWMSVIPHEINTMKEPIKNAFGKVLVLGLGLGYYAFHVSNKEEVESITIIENDKTVIEIFEKHILPKFQHKEKIRIFNKDAFDYLSEQIDYDFIFSDIWHNVGDGLPLYLKIKQYEKRYPNSRFEYWIEKSMLAMLRRQVLTVIEETLFQGFTKKDYLKANNINDQIINSLYFAVENYKIDTADDLRNLLSDESLKNLATIIKI